MSNANRVGGRRSPRAHRPTVLVLEGRTLLAASPRIDQFAVPTFSTWLTQVVDGPDDDLWFTEGDSGSSSTAIGRITPQGQITEFPVPTPAGGYPPSLESITAGPNDAIWAVDSDNGRVDEISHDGRVESFPIPGVSNDLTGLRTFGGIVAGADGNLWFGANPNAILEGFGSRGAIDPGTIDRITPEGVVTAFPLPLGGVGVASLAAGPTGVWFTDPAADRVGEIDDSGHVVEFGAPTPSDIGSTGLAIGPDGDAYYFAQGQAGSLSVIVKVSPAGAMTPIIVPGLVESNLLAGSDGVYFSSLIGPGSAQPVPSFVQLERLNPDGSLTTVLSTTLPTVDPTSTTVPTSTTPLAIVAGSLAFGPDGNLWSIEGGISVIDRAVLAPTPVPVPGPTLVVGGPDPITPTAGTASPGLVAPAGESATLDLAGFRHSADVSGVSATIDWGDGSATTAGTLGPESDAPPIPGRDPFVDGQVSGSHAYAKAGDYKVTVTVDATGPGGAAMSTSKVETVAAVDPSPSPWAQQSPVPLQAARSIAFQGVVGGFATPTPHDAAGSDFTATIDWGDGSATTAATASVNTPNENYGNPPTGPAYLFYVSGGHTYATTGSFTIEVTLSDRFGRSSTESTPIQVVAGPLAIAPTPPIPPATSTTISTPGATVYLGTLADFEGTVAGRTYSATVDWGDGSAPTAATVDPMGWLDVWSTGPATFSIDGTHAYAQAGDYTVKIDVADNQGDSAETTTTVQASAPASGLILSADYVGSAAAGGPIPAAPLASISNLAAGASASDFTATVDWGDGSPPTAGTVVADASIPGQPGSQFAVSGGHTYATPGLYSLTITVKGPDGSTSEVTTIVSVSLASAGGGTAATASGFVSGVAVAPVPLATFSAQAATAPATDFRATVDWGDGSPIQAAAIQATPAAYPGFEADFNVVAGHDYAQPGTYTATVTVVGADGIPDVFTVPIVVSAPPPPVVVKPVIVTAPPPTTPTPPPIVAPVPTPAPVVSPPSPPAMGPLPPTVLPSPLPKFAPTVVKHPKSVAHPHHKAAKPVAHHKDAKPVAHSKPVAHHAATPAKKAKPKATHHASTKPARVAPTKKHPAGPARAAKAQH